MALRFETGPETARVETAALFAQSFNDADGDLQPMNQWQGRLLVVNFWATWCAPCVEEMPDLQKVQVEYAERGVTVVGVAIDNASAVKRFRDEQKVDLPLLVAGAAGTELLRQLGNASGALPYTVLLDRSGRVVQSKLGRLHASQLRAWLDAAPSAQQTH
ncbi:MAG: TlpA family protein disulfide reductase [Burkholderiaceae bacterium]